ncbi:MAG: tRNA (adenosine(37)-N6)-dimethylallyltransferase MiaA [Gammaproteobacteria bacterium]|nr:tRNA (adenosine(37)-N6)-dimethylallyltransferase MiaA [Gammaproteobacteria bacterium]
MGPTATGKTDLALALAERLPLGLISVDSAMVYRHLDIGTGKPAPGTLVRHPHRLIDIRDPWEQYSAGDFVTDASRAVREISAAGRIPLLVGGTLLYFRSLTEGLSALPAADPDLRSELDARAAREGWPALHAELATLDPVAASRIGVMDRQRIQRALEVRRLTGQPISAQQHRAPAAGRGKFLKVALVPRDRQLLVTQITRRLKDMLECGFVGEVESLLALPRVNPGCPALRAVGYRQIAELVQGRCGLAEAENRALAATRQLAKRQLTWLRREDCDLWLDMESDNLLADLEKAVLAAVPRMQYPS